MLGSSPSCKWRSRDPLLLLLWEVDSGGPPWTLVGPSQKEQVVHTDEMLDQELAYTLKSHEQLRDGLRIKYQSETITEGA